MVCFRYVIVNTLYKGDSKDDNNDDDGNYNNNNNNILLQCFFYYPITLLRPPFCWFVDNVV